jgi:integrase
MAKAGIEVRHRKGCRANDVGRCNCEPTYRASVYDKRAGKLIRKSFPSHAAAKTWRQDALVAVRRGELKATPATTVRAATEAWLTGAENGLILNRSGDPYKPSAVRAYRQSLRLRVWPRIGDRRMSDVARSDVQELVDELVAEGLSPSTVQCALLPLRALYRRALVRGEVSINPTTGIALPAIRGKRDRIASPKEAAALLAALPLDDRAVWATAVYAGLRRGELLALQWEDVDLTKNLIHVRRSWDIAEQKDVGPKSAVGRRKVPITSKLKSVLAEHRLATGRTTGFVFGDGDRPVSPSALTDRARAAWTAANETMADGADPLERITLHECRHTFASLMIAAGVNAKALSTYMGHANIGITLDRYGHLMPGNEDEAAGLLDAYLMSAGG